MNQQNLTLLGRATQEPELLQSKAGKEFAKFSLAVNRYRGNPEEEQHATFYEVVSFGRQAKAESKKVHKGDVVFIAGVPQVYAYLSKSGEAKAKLTVSAKYMKAHTLPKYLREDPDLDLESAFSTASYPELSGEVAN